MRWFGHTTVCAAETVLFAFFLGTSAAGQSTPKSSSNASVTTISSVRVLPDTKTPTLEIVSTRPLVPAVSKLANPPRLVIDLPSARLAMPKKHIDFKTPEVDGVRLNQFQVSPPVARIVVDLTKPVTYSWEATGNLLLLHLGTSESSAKAPAAPAITPAMRPVAAPETSASTGTVLDATRLAAGSSVTAGSDAALVRLGRGGEVRVCPGTTVSVTPSQNNRSIMFGMSTGALEAHYSLQASADSILTPDFRILLPGPGEFHFAVSADSRGNTCIQALQGNTASVIVSELLGDGTYQVKPTDQIILRSGQLKNVSATAGSCGCPAPASAVMLASSVTATQPSKPPASGAATISGSGSETAALPPSNSNDVHVQVDAPFVFRGDEPNPGPEVQVVHLELLPLRSPAKAEPVETAILGPARAKPEHRGFMGKLKGFFAAMFG